MVKKYKKWYVLIIIALFMAFLPVKDWLETKNQSILRVGILGIHQAIDPHLSDNEYIGHIYGQVVEPLFRVEDGVLVPLLLEKIPVVSSDGLSYHFTLKKDIFFHNGSQMSSYDVQFFFERMFFTHYPAVNVTSFLSIAGARDLLAGHTQHLAGFEVLNHLEFMIYLEQVDPFFLYRLSAVNTGIYSMEAFLNAPYQWGLSTLIGSGPYQLLEYQPRKWIHLETFGSYHQDRDTVSRVEYKIYDNNLLMLEDYLQDRIALIPLAWHEYQENRRRISPNEVFMHERPAGYSLLLNQSHPILSDKRVRQAIAYALDRRELHERFFVHNHQMIYNFLPEDLLGSTSERLSPFRDIEKSKALLREAGYPNGFYLVDYYTNRSTFVVGQILQAQLRQVGINLILLHKDLADWDAINQRGEFAFMLYTPQVIYMDPDNFLYPLLHSSSRLSKMFELGNPALDQALEWARTVPDEQERKYLYQAMERFIIAEEQFIIPLLFLPEIFLVKKEWQDKIGKYQHPFYLRYEDIA